MRSSNNLLFCNTLTSLSTHELRVVGMCVSKYVSCRYVADVLCVSDESTYTVSSAMEGLNLIIVP